MSVTDSTVQLLPLAKELDESKVTPGVLGFLVFAVLGLAVWMLMKSMTKEMGKVNFTEAPKPGAATASGPSGVARSDTSPADSDSGSDAR
ncbi:hypothetical protein [Streptomyces oceani]|uniref:Uncharacterized protein n=1 Tax=Streptomyces oceani TaxID=1075402 RepID=A0A1E7KIF3_9ACTN|nr:hypothetical protein [Streptomyces oceani]OEV03677.1 hypothetical protein AN216_10520 [Streptomyces oceani]